MDNTSPIPTSPIPTSPIPMSPIPTTLEPTASASVALVSATLAPVALIGGWTIAAGRQPHFDSVHQTISALAAHGAQDRWIMTTGLATLGACHMITAWGLRPAANRGRVVLAAGGLATAAVAVFAQPATGSSPAHVVCAAIGFGCLTAWPVFAATRGAVGGSLLAPKAAAAGTGLLAALLVGFGVSLSENALVGLSERTLAGAQALWPLAVVLSVPLSNRLSDRRRAARQKAPRSPT